MIDLEARMGRIIKDGHAMIFDVLELSMEIESLRKLARMQHEALEYLTHSAVEHETWSYKVMQVDKPALEDADAAQVCFKKVMGE